MTEHLGDLLIVVISFAVVAGLPLWALTRRFDEPSATWPAGCAYPRYWHRRVHTGRHRYTDEAALPDADQRTLQVFRDAKRHICHVSRLGWPAVMPGEWERRRQEARDRAGAGDGRPYRLAGRVLVRQDREQQR